MALLPVDTRLKVESQIEDVRYPQDFRPYLGMSGIASPCARSLWYSFRWCSEREIIARIHRLFQRGHNEEPIIQADLRSIGIIHHSDQLEVTDCHGHCKGHIDDILERVPDAPKTPHLGEYKTHNDRSFKLLKKGGVKKSKPVHYGQMICYMRKLKLTRGLYVAVNKNDDSRYYERIPEDKNKADYYFSRANDIISSEVPPQRIGNATWYECKFCDHYSVCQLGERPLRTCRTCISADIHEEGVWKCSRYDIQIVTKQQQLPCNHYRILEGI